MKKKILTVFLIAVVAFFAVYLGSGEIFKNFSNIKEEKTPADCPVLIGDKVVFLGMDEEEVLKSFGRPCDTLISEYGFDWNIYHENYKNYAQIGIKDEKVVAVFTNSPEFVFEGLRSGEKKEKVNEKYGTALDGIVKGSTRYRANGTDIEIYEIRGGYVTFFYDTCENNSLTSLNIIDCDVEQEFEMLYAPGTDILKESFEKQNLYVTNAERAKVGLEPFKEHQGLDEVAYYHSCDMIENDYFSHTNKQEENVLKRAQNHNIAFKSIGENLAMGAQNPLYLHYLLMNSKEHRENILGDFTHMGVGVAFDEKKTHHI